MSLGILLELKNEHPTFELYFAALWQSLQKWISNRLKLTGENSIETWSVLPRSTSHQCHLYRCILKFAIPLGHFGSSTFSRAAEFGKNKS